MESLLLIYVLERHSEQHVRTTLKHSIEKKGQLHTDTLEKCNHLVKELATMHRIKSRLI